MLQWRGEWAPASTLPTEQSLLGGFRRGRAINIRLSQKHSFLHFQKHFLPEIPKSTATPCSPLIMMRGKGLCIFGNLFSRPYFEANHKIIKILYELHTHTYTQKAQKGDTFQMALIKCERTCHVKRKWLLPFLVWLGWLNVVPCTERSLAQFPVGVHTQVVGLIPGQGAGER